MDYTILKQKLIEVGIPVQIADRYVVGYRLGFAEFTFEEGKAPTDKNFAILKEYYHNFFENTKKEINTVLIHQMLIQPPEQYDEVKLKIKELSGKGDSKIEELFKKTEALYTTSTYEIGYIYELVSDYFSDKERVWAVFTKAINAGMFWAEQCIDAIVHAVGEKLAPDVLYETAVNGYLYTSLYSDPVEAIKYLEENFDSDTIAKILVEEPEYLYLYKDKYYVEFSEQKEKRMKEIQNIIEKYK